MAPATRPRVYLTLGTVSYGAVEILRRTALEIAALDVELLVAVGPAGDPALLGELPDRVHVERFVDQADVLRRVDLIVHHGGTGTVLAALEAGLPQLILPQGADQPFNAKVVAQAGAGTRQANADYTPGSSPRSSSRCSASAVSGRRPGGSLRRWRTCPLRPMSYPNWPSVRCVADRAGRVRLSAAASGSAGRSGWSGS